MADTNNWIKTAQAHNQNGLAAAQATQGAMAAAVGARAAAAARAALAAA